MMGSVTNYFEMTNDFKIKQNDYFYLRRIKKLSFAKWGGNLRLVRTLNNRYNRAILIKETAKVTDRKETV